MPAPVTYEMTTLSQDDQDKSAMQRTISHAHQKTLSNVQLLEEPSAVLEFVDSND